VLGAVVPAIREDSYVSTERDVDTGGERQHVDDHDRVSKRS